MNIFLDIQFVQISILDKKKIIQIKIYLIKKITILIVANSSLSILRNSQFSSVVIYHGDLQKKKIKKR